MEQVLYSSEAYHVVHKKVGDKDIFEIQDKLLKREVTLSSWMAKMFEDQLYAWQDDTPWNAQVEFTLGAYMQLARIPNTVH